PRAAAIGLDDEARRLDGALGVAVRVAAPREPGPGRLQRVLQPRLPRARGAHVLEHAQPPAVLEHAPDFAQPDLRARDAAEDEAADHGVEGAVAEGQGLGA